VDERLGRIEYRRRKEEDAWVVPYMPCLTRLLQCHINADVCFTVNIFMYLYKYLFKGPDHARFQIETTGETELNEFEDYIQARYLSSAEAVWRILNFNITNKTPAIVALAVHLPGRNLPQMRRSNGQQSHSSQLLQYFARPHEAQFESLTYCQFFSQYRHEKITNPAAPLIAGREWLERPLPNETTSRRKIILRARDPIVTRIQNIPPRLGELFYLRALLLHRSAYSFTDLRTVDGTEFPTFQQAAQAIGLFESQNEAEFVMDEAIASYYRPGQLRFLFAHLLVDLATPAIDLWERYKESLSLDFRLHAPARTAEKQALHQIESYLAARGAALGDFGLSTGEHRPREVEMEIEAFESRMDVLWHQAQLAVNQMNPEQAACYHTILDDCWSNGPHRLYFIDGKAGRGKTFLVRAICDTVTVRRRLLRNRVERKARGERSETRANLNCCI
jgi:hypothetical protein